MSVQKLAESENGIKRGAQFVAHPREEFTLCFARALYLVHELVLGDIFDSAFVIDDHAVCVSNGASILAEPNFGAVFAINFILEKFDETLFFNQPLELGTTGRIDIDRLSDVGDASHELYR